MKTFIIAAWLTACFAAFASVKVFSQKAGKTPKSQVQISKVTEGAIYKFKATNMFPMKGSSSVLTTDYIVVFSKDTLAGNLPYMGVATSVTYGSRDGGVNLATGGFSITEPADKKGSYVVKYKLNGSNDITDVTFTIYKNGTADASFHFFQRDPVSYRGNVTKIEKP